MSTLKSLKNQQSSIGKKQRLYTFIYLKESKFRTLQQLANYLGVNVRSLEKWVSQYKEHGIGDLLLSKSRRVGSKIITPQINQGLEERSKDANNPFKGYWDQGIRI